MTDVEKVLAIHEWLVRECDYDYVNYLKASQSNNWSYLPNADYSIVGVFKNGSAVFLM